MSTPCKIIVKTDKGDINIAMRFDNTYYEHIFEEGKWYSRKVK